MPARTSILSVTLILAGLVLTSCGGGSGTDSRSTMIDPANADQVAHQALLAESDLPGTGWRVTKSDQFDSSSNDVNTPACKDINSQQQAAKSKADAARAGRAEKELSRETSSPIPLAIETEVNIFKDTSTPADVLKLFTEATKSKDFGTCLQDSVNSSAGQDTKMNMKSVNSTVAAPTGGSAVAYDFSFSVQGQTFNMRFETYLWAYANSGVTVTVSGASEDVTADVVKAALDKTQGKLEASPKN